MAATYYDIKRWFESAEKRGSTHMIVYCDDFDFEDYPVYMPSELEARRHVDEHNGKNMQRVMEVYKIELGWEAQSKGRVMNW